MYLYRSIPYISSIHVSSITNTYQYMNVWIIYIYIYIYIYMRVGNCIGERVFTCIEMYTLTRMYA